LPILRTGIQVRRSEDLVHREFIGWTFNGRPSQAAEHITSKGGRPVLSAEQTEPDIQKAVLLTLHADGTFDDDANNTWTFNNQILEMNWNNVTIDKMIVEKV
jgi:hypothetical protein